MFPVLDGTRRTLIPAVTPPQPWQASTAYVVGEQVVNGANVYTCDQAGTSASSGGPTGTGANITDGTARWDYASPPYTTTAHITWNGHALIDPYQAWTQNGTVPQVTGTRAGVGPLSDANYYSHATSNVFGFSATGGFTLHIVGKMSSASTQRVLVSNGNGGGGQHGFYVIRQTDGRLTAQGGADGFSAGSTNNALGARFIYTLGMTAANVWSVKLNGGTTVTDASGSFVPANGASPMLIGKLTAASGYGWDGEIYEIAATTKPFLEAEVAALHSIVVPLL